MSTPTLFHRVKKTVREDAYVRLAILSTLAASISFAIGSVMTSVSAVTAAITALVSIKPTFHATAQEAVRQILGTIIGALLAFLLISFTGGFSAITLGIITGFCFLLAKLLKLGQNEAIVLAITIYLVAGFGMGTEAIEVRFLGVIFGSLIGLLASLYALPGTPTTRALDTTLEHADRLAEILNEISELITHPKTTKIQTKVTEYLEETQQILRDLETTQTETEEAVTGAKWSPMLRKEDAEHVLHQVKTTSSMARIIIGMCHDLLLAVENTEPLPPAIKENLSEVFSSLSEAISEATLTVKDDPSASLSVESEPLANLAEASQQTVQQLRSLDETAPLLLGGSILKDSEKIEKLLTGKTPS